MLKLKELGKINKKGSILDWFYVIVAMFLIGVVVIICLIVINKVTDSGIFADDPSAQGAVDMAEITLLNFDNSILFIIIGLSIFVLVSSYFVWNHPAFFFIGLVLLGIAVFISAIFSRVFEDLSTTAALNATTAQFPKMIFIMDKLPVYIAIMGMLAAIVMYIGFGRQ